MITINRPKDRSSYIKLYANVPSRSRTGVTHKVAYIRKAGMERWTCTCEDQVIIKTAKRRHCAHIRAVRSQIASDYASGE